jgi:hypothetical protein
LLLFSRYQNFMKQKKCTENYRIINQKRYCSYVLLSKIDKKKMFEDKLKNNEERNHGP